MKVYTKTGDKGETSLIGGTRVPKNHHRIEAYGTVDELNSAVGLVRDQDIDPKLKALLIEVQDRLFTMGSLLANDPERNSMKLPQLAEEDISLLEKEMDRMLAGLPEMRSFVLPGGHQTVSFCHLARCICRRAERNVIGLSSEVEVSDLIVRYLNRLSDFLFVLSRQLTQDLGAEEIPWKPKM